MHTSKTSGKKSRLGLQYVFAIAAGVGFEAGGELYKSDYYGGHESWKNITGDLPGIVLAFSQKGGLSALLSLCRKDHLVAMVSKSNL